MREKVTTHVKRSEVDVSIRLMQWSGMECFLGLTPYYVGFLYMTMAMLWSWN